MSLTITAESGVRIQEELSAHARGQASRLVSWLATEFAVMDLDGERIGHEPTAVGAVSLPLLVEECRAAYKSRCGRAVVHGPVAVGIVPLVACDDSRPLAAAGLFLLRRPHTADEFAELAKVLGMDSSEARIWSARHELATSHSVRQLCAMATARLVSESRHVALQDELTRVAAQLAAQFEQSEFVQQLTGELRLARTLDDLAETIAHRLMAALPVEGVAVALPTQSDRPSQVQERFYTAGRVCVERTDCDQIVALLAASRAHGPVVVTSSAEGALASRWPQVRELGVVPWSLDTSAAGYVMALNRRDGQPLGPVECEMLAAAAGLLSVHAQNLQHHEQRSETMTGIIRALACAIDARDPYTRGHSHRVGQIASRLAASLGCSREMREAAFLAGLLHDVGKIGVDETLLRKEGRLTDAEFEHVKSHVRIGHQLLRDVERVEPLLAAVLHHHEAWDGRGYPAGQREGEIPFLARLVAVADAFDALLTDRPYRRGLEDAQLDRLFIDGTGRQWDPDIVAALFRCRDELATIVRTDQASDRESHPRD